MRSKIFQEILDETPEDVEIFVRLYADLVVRINQLLVENNISKKQLSRRKRQQQTNNDTNNSTTTH